MALDMNSPLGKEILALVRRELLGGAVIYALNEGE